MLFSIIMTNLVATICGSFGVKWCKKHKEEDLILAVIVLSACAGMMTFFVCSIIINLFR